MKAFLGEVSLVSVSIFFVPEDRLLCKTLAV
jgi:hypothetical protein